MQNYVGVAAASGVSPIAGAIVNPADADIVDFSIPAGVRRLTLFSNEFFVPAGALIRLGTVGGVLTTGYKSSVTITGVYGGARANSTEGLLVPECGPTTGFCMTFYRTGPNGWNCGGQSMYTSSAGYVFLAAGAVQLPGELTTFKYIPGYTIQEGSLQLLWEF